MVNYNNGKIYKIEPITGGEVGDVYVGSTCKMYLSQRMTCHRAEYTCWKAGKRNRTTSCILFDKYGVENCQIILLETVNVNTKDELIAREKHYIKSLECVNKHIAGRSKREYIIDNCEAVVKRRANYYQTNKVVIYDKQKLYRGKKRQEKLDNQIIQLP